MDRTTKILHGTIAFLAVSGGVLFTVGSIVMWPTFTNVSPFAGGIMFIIGSVEFLLVDILASIVEPMFSPLRPLRNIGALRTVLSMTGNLSFIVGSVFFLPIFPPIIGEDIFIIGSVFIWVPQVITCWGLYTLNTFTAQFYYAYHPYRRYVIMTNIMLAFACMLFFVGSVLYKDENSETIGLYQEGILMFIVGSALFLFGAMFALLMRKKRMEDPLQDHHKEIQMAVAALSQRKSQNLPLEPVLQTT